MNRPNRQAVQVFCKERVYQMQDFPDLEAGKARRQPGCGIVGGFLWSRRSRDSVSDN